MTLDQLEQLVRKRAEARYPLIPQDQINETPFERDREEMKLANRHSKMQQGAFIEAGLEFGRLMFDRGYEKGQQDIDDYNYRKEQDSN